MNPELIFISICIILCIITFIFAITMITYDAFIPGIICFLFSLYFLFLVSMIPIKETKIIEEEILFNKIDSVITKSGNYYEVNSKINRYILSHDLAKKIVVIYAENIYGKEIVKHVILK